MPKGRGVALFLKKFLNCFSKNNFKKNPLGAAAAPQPAAALQGAAALDAQPIVFRRFAEAPNHSATIPTHIHPPLVAAAAR